MRNSQKEKTLFFFRRSEHKDEWGQSYKSERHERAACGNKKTWGRTGTRRGEGGAFLL